ncbi:hypothetical protein [Leptolyngbya sp. FACHB-261]|uniref:hypothetical protein n=1 Tax=Leptolyngbya sp. FACHB-261 TaxID=2692806 RepID=UPI001685765D|nr:hypothetical protein [Leptolyngbya sp. FACHB-261]MBD2103758.1 hypothetical protein [Leptolyngbya sp. FACHB-261]
MKSSLKNAPLVALFTLGLASVAQAANIPAQSRNHMLTASASVIGPSDAQYGVRNLQAAVPGQVVDHILAASASPEANGYYTGLIQQA